MSQPQPQPINNKQQQQFYSNTNNNNIVKKIQYKQINSPMIENDQSITTIQINAFQWKQVDKRRMGNNNDDNDDDEMIQREQQASGGVDMLELQCQRREFGESTQFTIQQQFKYQYQQKNYLLQQDKNDDSHHKQKTQLQTEYNAIIKNDTQSQPHLNSPNNLQTQLNQHITQRLQSLSWSLQKIYYRNFFNRLITFYIQSLKQEQRKIRQTKQIQIKQLKQQNWPFKELYYKKYRTPNQQIMFEFVNLCAEKIQATFKAYIMQKRHKLAITKINRFKQKLCAVLKGWKTSNIFNCKKIQQIRKNFKQTSLQIDQQIENPNVDRIKKMRKIDYLQLNQQTLRQSFKKCFGYLYDSGAWIFQVQKCMKVVERRVVENKGNRLQGYRQYNNDKQETNKNIEYEDNRMVNNNSVVYQQNLRQQKPLQKQKRGRQRQFRAVSKNKPKNNYQQSQKNTSQFDTPITSSSSTTNYQTPSVSQQRPIVAKGKYEFTQDDIKNNQNEFLKMSDMTKNKKQQQQQINNNNTLIENKNSEINDDILDDNTIQQPKVNKFRDEQKKKLNKRQKYDPRKAIQEEKKRIQQEKRLKLLQKEKQLNQNGYQTQQQIKQSTVISNNNIKKPNNNNKKQLQLSQSTTTPKRTPRIEQQKKQQPQQVNNIQTNKQQQSSKQKTVQKIKKQNKLTKKGDNNKSIKSIVVNHKKVQSKVDCWGPKRQSANNGQRVSINGGGMDENNISSYKSKYLTGLIKQRTQSSKSYHQNQQSRVPMSNQHQQQHKSRYQQFQQEQHISHKPTYSYIKNRQNRNQQQRQQQYRQEETYQSSYLRKLVEEKESGKFSYVNGRLASIGKGKVEEKNLNRFIVKKEQEQRLQQRFQNLSNHIKQRIASTSQTNNNINNNNPSTFIQKPTQNSQQKKPTTANQSHRSIQSLQQVYSSQYTDRLNNLKNKLNMLQSARYIQRDQSVPVLLEDSRYVRKMYKDGMFSTLYWPQVRSMETTFLDYVKLTGF